MSLRALVLFLVIIFYLYSSRIAPQLRSLALELNMGLYSFLNLGEDLYRL